MTSKKPWSLDEDCALVDFVYENLRTGVGVVDVLHEAAEQLDRSYNSVQFHWYKEIVPFMEAMEVAQQ